jgi:hypothetical protein
MEEDKPARSERAGYGPALIILPPEPAEAPDYEKDQAIVLFAQVPAVSRDRVC